MVTAVSQDDAEEVFKVNTGWFHVVRDMFEAGAVARMGATAFALYCAIRCFAAGATGRARPSVSKLGQYVGVSPRTVARLLRDLEALGYIQCTLRQGRPSSYITLDQFRVTRGRLTVSHVSAVYVPNRFMSIREAVERAAMGAHANPAICVEHVEHLNVFVQLGPSAEKVIHTVSVDNRDTPDN
jgi:hypothetical protein